jgi:dTDP-4-amino-4,6-dideoxygalactose transaminase
LPSHDQHHVEGLEALAARLAGTAHALATSHPAVAAQVLLEGLGLQEGDEILCGPFVREPLVCAVRALGLRLRLVDIEPRGMTMDIALSARALGPRVKAVLVVNTGWRMSAAELAALAQRAEIPLIEDAGPTLGSPGVGKQARASLYCLGPWSALHTGTGGLLACDDDALMERARRRLSGKLPGLPLCGGALAPSACALGLATEPRLEARLARRRDTAQQFLEELLDIDDIVLQEMNVRCGWSRLVVRLGAGRSAWERDEVIRQLRHHALGAAPGWRCVHESPGMDRLTDARSGDLPLAESMAGRSLHLPCFDGIGRDEIHLVCQELGVALRRLREGGSRPVG